MLQYTNMLCYNISYGKIANTILCELWYNVIYTLLLFILLIILTLHCYGNISTIQLFRITTEVMPSSDLWSVTNHVNNPYNYLICLRGIEISFSLHIQQGNQDSIPHKHIRFCMVFSHSTCHCMGLMMV